MKKKHFRKWMLLTASVLSFGLTACGVAPQETEPAATEIPEEKEPELSEEELAAIRREETLVPILEEAKGLAEGYFYEEAIEKLQEVPEEFAQDEDVTAALSAYNEGLSSFVPYEQPVRHIFFHSLIVDNDHRRMSGHTGRTLCKQLHID